MVELLRLDVFKPMISQKIVLLESVVPLAKSHFAKGGTLESRRSQGYASMASASTYMIGRKMLIAQRYLWKISVRESIGKGYLPPTTILA